MFTAQLIWPVSFLTRSPEAVMVVQSDVAPSLWEVVMALVFIAKDPDTDERNCPTV